MMNRRTRTMSNKFSYQVSPLYQVRFIAKGDAGGIIRTDGLGGGAERSDLGEVARLGIPGMIVCFGRFGGA